MRGPCVVYSCPNQGVHVYPRNETLRAQWVKSIKKLARPYKKYSCICSAHFKPTDFIHSPPMFDGEPTAYMLKKKSVPSIFPWTCKTNKTDPEDNSLKFDSKLVSKTYAKTESVVTFVEELPLMALNPTTLHEDPLKCRKDNVDIKIEFENVDQLQDCTEAATCEINDSAVNDELKDDTEAARCDMAIKTDDGCISKGTDDDTDEETPAFSAYTYIKKKIAVHFYTGLETFDKVIFVFKSLGESVHNLKYIYGPPPKKLDPFDQFFMTLIILSQHKTFKELSVMYLISVKQVSNIFITWIRCMSSQWRLQNLWVDKITLLTYMPLDFYNKYPASKYHKVKFLIGISQNGLITYVSSIYGGSDRQFIERSGILHQFECNDAILVDKGLNVQDVFVSYGVTVIRREFFRKANQKSSDTSKETRKVARKDDVRRVIGLMKTYKILTQPMNVTENLLINDIVYICAMLANFQSNIIIKKE